MTNENIIFAECHAQAGTDSYDADRFWFDSARGITH